MSRVVLITGGTRGIGRALAETLLRAGDKVAVTGTSEDGVVKAERELAAFGEATAIVCDVREV
jgi:3-oxoacyl-[acyl-carrier protein] reductase